MKGSNNRIPYFSSPYIYYNGVATGLIDGPSTSSSFNAGRINETGCIVSNFTPSNSINPFIQVSEENCLLNLTAIVEPTNPLYAYSWKWSLDGLFNDFYPGQQLGVGVGSSISTQQPIQQPCEVYFIQLIVSISNGPGVPATIVAKEVISKRGDICTDNVEPCDEINTFGLIQQKDENQINQQKITNQIDDTTLLNIKEYYLFDLYGRQITSNSSIDEIENYLRRLPLGMRTK